MTADVDVVMAVRNGGVLLRDAVDSVLDQRGVSVRLFVVDDGSTDGAPQRLPADDRLEVIPNAGRGVPAALNTGIGRGSAEFVAIHDADDTSLAGRLAAEIDHLERHPGIGLVATAFEVQVGRRVVATVRTLPTGLLDKNPICHGSVMMRRSLVEAVGGYRTQFAGCEDYDMWLRIAEVAGVSILPVVGYRYRVWANQTSVRRPSSLAAWADLARSSARARAADRPDPAEGAPSIGSDETGDQEVQAWWAREFAALGSWADALRCLRRLPPRRALSEALRLRARQPQVVWS